MKTLKLILPLLAVLSLQLFPQQEVTISDPVLSFYNDTLVIRFDILNCSEDALFTVNPRILKSDGKIIPTSNISGDLGENIRCGKNKEIIWSLAKDNVRLDDDIQVEIYVEQLNEDVAEEVSPDIKEVIKERNDRLVDSPLSTYSRGNIIASSFFVPGLGQSKVNSKKSPLILSVLGYGCLAASTYYIIDSNKKYDQYLDSEFKEERDRLFGDSEKSYKRARYFVYGAAGVWAVNLIWSAVIPSGRSDNFSAGMSANDIHGMQLYAKWTF